MSMQVNNPNHVDANQLIEQLAAALGKMGVTGSSDSGDSIPSITISFDINELPTLSAPAGPLSLDTLMSAIGNETRRQACRDGVNSLELKGEQQAEINQKELEELKEQIEKMAKKGIADMFLKVFQVIGMVIGAIASAASLVTGIATGNPLLIAAGVAGIVMTANSAVSMATDGEHGIAGWVSKGLESLGVDAETAQWIGMGVEIVLNVAVIALNIGGAVSAGSKAVDATSKILQVMAKGTTVANMIGGVNMMATGATTIASSAYGYQIAQSQADVKELEAILERLRMAMEMERDMIENEMERANQLLEAVDAIVDACNKTQGTVLTMSPAMA